MRSFVVEPDEVIRKDQEGDAVTYICYIRGVCRTLKSVITLDFMDRPATRCVGTRGENAVRIVSKVQRFLGGVKTPTLPGLIKANDRGSRNYSNKRWVRPESFEPINLL